MVNLWKAIKRALWVIFGVILVTVFLNIMSGIIGEYIPTELKEKVISYINEFIELCLTHWILSLTSLAILVVLMVYAWKKEKTNEFRRIWEFYKPAKKVTPEDFKIQRYKEACLPRASDMAIESHLKNVEYVLVTGKPKIGKTRTTYERINKLEEFSVIKAKPEDIEVEKVKIPPLSNRNLILFLDDLQRFVGKNVDDVIDRLKKKSKKLIVVATCRTGEELNLVKEEILPLYREFISIELEEISEEEGKRLAKDLGVQWKPEQFDGTPGSIILDLEDMKERYKKAGDGRVILKASKLLWEGNLFVYRETRVKDICREIFELPAEKLTRYNWDEIINNLKENDFITTAQDIIHIYPSYLDTCVYDYDPSLNDLMKLKDTLIRAKDSGSLFYLGNRFNYKKDFRQAEGCYRKALSIYPRYASAHNSLGYVLTKFGETEEAKGKRGEAEGLYKEAEKEHRDAISINPFYATNHNNLGYVLTRLGEIEEIKGEYDAAKRLFEEAEQEHRTAIRLKPVYASAHHSLAFALGKMGRYEEAEKEYQEAIRLAPESPFAHNLLGHLLVAMGRHEEAEKEYKEAIRIKPDYPSARNNLGYLLKKLGRYEEARKQYDEVLRASPDYIVAYINLGHLLADWGRYEEAEREFRKALKINPDYAEARTALGYALVKLKRYEKAENEYREAIRIKSDYGEAHTNLGYLLVLLGDDQKGKRKDSEAKRLYDEAGEEYAKALQIDPNDEDALICLGILMERLNRDEEAEDCYKKVIEKNPRNIEARYTYEYFLSHRGREEEAKREFDKIITISPGDTKARDQLVYLHRQLPRVYAKRARALIKSGEFDKAEGDLMKAITLDPNNALAHKNLGILREEQGDKAQREGDKARLYEEAEKEYQKTLKLNPMYPSAHRHLANSLAKLGRDKEADNEYKETKKVAHDYPKNNRDFGIFLAKIGKKEEAKTELEVAIQLFAEQGNEKEAQNTRDFLNSL